MRSDSARVSGSRPFYAAHADAYDLLITDDVGPWVAAVHQQLPGPSRVLDLGCGTGRHAAGLLDLGHDVELADASADLLELARGRCPKATATRVVDLIAVPPDPRFDAVTCRGVLNDLLSDRDRSAALGSIAGQLRPGGLLFLDVREADAARPRADREPRSRQVTLPSGAELTFTSSSTMTGVVIRVHEEYLLQVPGAAAQLTTYEFAMRPWTRAELDQGLTRTGFDHVTIAPGVGRKTPDRLFVTARSPS